MKTLTLDLETLPDQSIGAYEKILSTITPPGNIKKPESIAAWMAENGTKAAEEKYRKTALDGTHGEIVVIGFAIDDGEPLTYFRSDIATSSEEDLIRGFYNDVACYVTGQFQIVGHNVRNFDLRFLFQRSVINGVMPPFSLHQDGRYNNEHVYDTMLAWGGWGNFIGLQRICEALGIEAKTGDITGATVWDAIQAGRIDDVAAYCRQDVAATREVYQRLTFGGKVW